MTTTVYLAKACHIVREHDGWSQSLVFHIHKGELVGPSPPAVQVKLRQTCGSVYAHPIRTRRKYRQCSIGAIASFVRGIGASAPLRRTALSPNLKANRNREKNKTRGTGATTVILFVCVGQGNRAQARTHLEARPSQQTAAAA
jgi:hypothetical protein